MKTRGGRINSGGGGGGGGSGDYAVRTVTTTDSAGTADRVLWLDTSTGAFNFTLPSAAERAGRPLTLVWVAGSAPPTAVPQAGHVISALPAGWTPLLIGESVNVIANGASTWFTH